MSSGPASRCTSRPPATEPAQRIAIDLGVDRRRVDAAVPQHVCNFGERRAMPEHLRRGRLPEHVSSTGRDPDATQRLDHDTEDARAAQPDMGRVLANEDVARVHRRSTMAEVQGERTTDIWWERQARYPRGLATDRDLARPPIDVVKFETGDIADAKPKAKEQTHDRGRPLPRRRGRIVQGQQTLDLIRSERLGEHARRQPATAGTPLARSRRRRRVAKRNRSQERSAVTSSWRELMLLLRVCTMKRWRSVGESRSQRSLPPRNRPTVNRSASHTYVAIVDGKRLRCCER